MFGHGGYERGYQQQPTWQQEQQSSGGRDVDQQQQQQQGTGAPVLSAYPAAREVAASYEQPRGVVDTRKEQATKAAVGVEFEGEESGDREGKDDGERDVVELVPVRVSVGSGRQHAAAVFCWDPTAEAAAAQRFAAYFCRENGLPAEPFTSGIVDAISSQVESASSIPFQRGAEQLTVIELDFNYEEKHIADRFVWDICNMSADVEAFAETCCRDMGLGEKFVPVYAHQLREGILSKRREAAGGGSVEVDAGLAPNGNLVRLRGQWEEWEPRVKDAPAENTSTQQPNKHNLSNITTVSASAPKKQQPTRKRPPPASQDAPPGKQPMQVEAGQLEDHMQGPVVSAYQGGSSGPRWQPPARPATLQHQPPQQRQPAAAQQAEQLCVVPPPQWVQKQQQQQQQQKQQPVQGWAGNGSQVAAPPTAPVPQPLAGSMAAPQAPAHAFQKPENAGLMENFRMRLLAQGFRPEEADARVMQALQLVQTNFGGGHHQQ